MSTSCIVSTEWLNDHLDAPDLVIVDASWHMPAEQRDPYREFRDGHIPGAIFFDIDDISDTDSDLPHMLPGNAKFSSRMRKMGIGDGKRIVVYDSKGMFSAPRAWWTFRVMGVEDVAVLDGGLPKWLAEDRPVESGDTMHQERHFTPRRISAMVFDVDDVQRIVRNPDNQIQIVDARSPGRFQGSDPEPREGLRSGRIPGSKNLPFTVLLNDDGTFKSNDEIRNAFHKAEVDLGKPIVTSCGSGVTAAVLALALERIGHTNTGVYDGSWTEWGGCQDLPIETG